MPLLRSNVTAPRRMSRSPIDIPIDLTVTPPGTGAVPGQILPGELVYLTANKGAASLATAGTANANAASAIGVAAGAYPVVYAAGIIGSNIPPGDPNVPQISIYEDGDHLFQTTAGDNYNPYDTVYLGADGRTISKTVSGSAVGYVSPDQRQSSQTQLASFPIAGGAGVLIYIRIKPALAA